MRRIVLLLVTIVFAASSISQNADTVTNSRLSLRTEFVSFFKDNEFSAEKMSGYTLPGFYFRPRVVWNVDRRVRLETGVHWLHYWGATSYPRLISFSPFPEMGEKPRSGHVLPWMQACVDVLPQLTLVFGSLENNEGHHLPLPLYDPELIYAADPDAGVQMLLKFKHFDADIWVDWKDFIFRNSKTQERFIFGTSLNINALRKRSVTLDFPMHLLAQHTGGEMLAEYIAPISVFNFAGGVQLKYSLSNVSNLKTGCSLVGFTHSGDVALPFDKGWGVYSYIGAFFWGASFDIAYWHGDDFIPLLGSPHFSQISLNTEGLVFDPMDMLVLRADYRLGAFRHTMLSFEGMSYIYLPYSGDRPGFPKVERGAAASFSFGLLLKVNPKISLGDIHNKLKGYK